MEKTLGIWCGAKNIAAFCKYEGLEHENNFKEKSFKFTSKKLFKFGDR